MRVLGLDPGLSLTGYGCIDADPAAPAGGRLVEAGVLRMPTRRSLPERLATLARDLDQVLDDLRPGLVAVESVFHHGRNPRTAIMMGHARGVLLLGAATRSLPVVELPPATIKRAVTGSGRAGKAQVQSAVATSLRLAGPPEPPDVADAIAIALTALTRGPDPAGAPLPAPTRAR